MLLKITLLNSSHNLSFWIFDTIVCVFITLWISLKPIEQFLTMTDVWIQ